VTSVQRSEEGFVLSSVARTVRARAIVLATGTRPRKLNVRGEDLPWVVQRWTDIRSRSGTVAVVGGGDLAVDQALSLHEAGHEVALLVRGTRIECNRRLQDELVSAPSITIRQHFTVEAFSEGPPRAVDGSVLGTPGSVEVDGVLVSIGREPDAPRFLDLEGRAMSQDYVLAYGEKGLFPCGDLVARGNRRQVAIAAGSGLDAAMRCDEYLGGANH
jgi:thioredoxin reductase (NADPH)